MTRLKICGLTRKAEIAAVNAALPDYIGFVFAESRRRVSVATALALRRNLAENIAVVGVFNETVTEEGILEALSAGAADMAQLHGSFSENFIQTIQRENIPVIRAVSVSGRESIEACQNTAAAHILLDNGSGGTGQTFDWALCRFIRRPYFLAGGIHAGNLGQALALAPFAVDVSSGAETNGLKDSAKIAEIAALVKGGK